MKNLYLYFLGFLFAIVGLSPAAAQEWGSIEGTVYLTGSETIIRDATVRLVGLNYSESVNESGKFVFEDVPAGSVLLRVESPAYGRNSKTVTVIAGVTVQVDVEVLRHILLEDLIISAGPTALSRTELVNPVQVISGNDLTESHGITLGESLNRQPGIASTYYGPAASRPIIGGVGGSRVKILQSALDIGEVSDQSEDHAVGVEAFDAQSIEVIRGPATLLYGSDITGGVVNVIEGRVPTERPVNQIEGKLMARGAFGASERGGGGNITGSFGNVVWRARGLLRETGDVSTPLFNPEGVHDEDHDDHKEEDPHEHDDEEHDEHEEEHDEHSDEEISLIDHIENSGTSMSRGSLGMSWLGKRGYIGVAVSIDNKDYGVPGHAHDHHEHDDHGDDDHDDHGDDDHDDHGDDDHDDHGDDDHDDHGDDDHDDHGDDDDHGHEEEIGEVSLDLQSIAYDIEGAYRFGDAAIKAVRFRLGLVDYNHTEIEQSEEGSDGVGAVYDNHQFEGRFELDHSILSATRGIAGIQFKRRDLDVSGSHASQPKTLSTDFGIFALERIELGDLKLEFTGRLHFKSYDAEGKRDRSFSLFSLGGGVNYELNDYATLSMSLARGAKPPSIAELYSDGLHTAIRSVEIGNENLNAETTNNVTISGHVHSDILDLTLTGYLNQSNNFIYFARTGEVEGTLPVLATSQGEATITGVEIDTDIELFHRGTIHIIFGLTGDYVRGRLTEDDTNLPRITPLRVGASLQYSWDNFLAKLSLRHVASQDQVFYTEEETDGYTMMDALLRYRLIVGNIVQAISLQGINLTDQLARSHTSLLKETVPLPGRDIRLTYTFHF